MDAFGGESAGENQPHGFCLSPEDEVLLRGPVPELALRWAADALGAGARVLRSVPLVGGSSSAIHAIDIEDRRGLTHALVLRRFVREDWLAEEPDVAEREAAALAVLTDCLVPTPRLVAVDPDGSAAGVSAVLMTRLPGAIVWDPPQVDEFLRALAEVLPTVHATPVAADVPLPAYESYPLKMQRPPAWATRPEVWLRAIELLDGPPPSAERVFIHRDYHPGNVLWEDGRVCGVIDWVNASVGCPWADVGHCRVNLASELGQAAVERFLDYYRVASGRADDYHPYWDIAAAIGGLDEDVDDAPSPEDENFLAKAVDRL